MKAPPSHDLQRCNRCLSLQFPVCTSLLQMNLGVLLPSSRQSGQHLPSSALLTTGAWLSLTSPCQRFHWSWTLGSAAGTSRCAELHHFIRSRCLVMVLRRKHSSCASGVSWGMNMHWQLQNNDLKPVCTCCGVIDCKVRLK